MTTQDLPKGFMLYDDYVVEYRAATAALDLELPPGVELPDTPPAEPEPGTQYESGSGEVQALLTWLHAVENAAVDAYEAGDDEGARRWLRIASMFVTTETFQKFNDHTAPVSWYAGVIVPALNGNFGPLAADANRSLIERQG